MSGQFVGFPRLVRSALEALTRFGKVDSTLVQKLTLDDRMSSWLAPTNAATQFGIKDLAAFFGDVVRHDFKFQSGLGEVPFHLAVPRVDDFDNHLTFREFLEGVSRESRIVVPTRVDQDALLRQEVRDLGPLGPRKPTSYSRIDEKLREIICLPSDVHLYLLIGFVFSFKAYRQNVSPGQLNLNDSVRKYFPISQKNGEDLLTDFLQFIRIRAEQWSLGDPGCPNFSGGIVQLIANQSGLYPIPETLLDLLEAINSRFGMMTGSAMRLNNLAQQIQRDFLPRPKAEFEDLLSEIEKSMPRGSGGSFRSSGVRWDMCCEEVDGRLRLEFGHTYQRNADAHQKKTDRHKAAVASGTTHRCGGFSVDTYFDLTQWQTLLELGNRVRCLMGMSGTASLNSDGSHSLQQLRNFWPSSGGAMSRRDFFLCEEVDASRNNQIVGHFLCSRAGDEHVRISESQFRTLNDHLWSLISRTLDRDRN